MRIGKVYTRTGDDGTTALVGGARVPKDSLRVESYGTVDELNAVLGLARAYNAMGEEDEAAARLEEVLQRVQDELFDLGSELATPHDFTYEGQPKIGEDRIRALEQTIDTFNPELPKLDSFVLPGGGPVSGFLHLARTVCRRAERILVRLHREEPETGSGPVTYLNRLSDLLFVLARWAGKHRGETEVLWKKGLEVASIRRKRKPRT